MINMSSNLKIHTFFYARHIILKPGIFLKISSFVLLCRKWHQYAFLVTKAAASMEWNSKGRQARIICRLCCCFVSLGYSMIMLLLLMIWFLMLVAFVIKWLFCFLQMQNISNIEQSSSDQGILGPPKSCVQRTLFQSVSIIFKQTMEEAVYPIHRM